MSFLNVLFSLLQDMKKSLRSSLENNPFIFEASSGFSGRVFVPENISGDFVGWLAGMHKDCFCNGMGKLQVFCSEKLQMSDLSGLDIMSSIELKSHDSVF